MPRGKQGGTGKKAGRPKGGFRVSESAESADEKWRKSDQKLAVDGSGNRSQVMDVKGCLVKQM